MEETKKTESGKDMLSRRKLLSAGAAAIGAAAMGGLIGADPASSGEPINIEINGKKVTSSVPATIVKGTTLVPVRVVSENLGAKVEWVQGSKTVKIDMAPPKVQLGDKELPAWPWPYKKLDPEVVRKRGYENYFKGGCCYAAASALLSTLVEEVGFPYTLIPQDMFKYGAGGSASWGTLCGALNGSSAVINMVTKDFNDMVNELNGWYTQFPFPTDKHEAYCKVKKQGTTIAKSPLCHVSVSTWVNAQDPKERVNEAGKKDRCAKLSGDVAAKAVELMNAKLVNNNFALSYKTPTEYEHCMSCHTGEKSALDNQQGKMNCLSCHDDHNK